MASSQIRGILTSLVVAAATPACGNSTRGAVQTSSQPAPSGQADSSGIAEAQADSARYPYTAADVHFMSGMISHHAQALVMAGWAPRHGAGSSVRILAERIVNGQQDEIATIQQWLRDRRQTAQHARPTGMRMTMGGTEHEMLMPGMLTQDQMKLLDQARGTEFDRLFLTFMIQHHRGAITMVQALFGSFGAGQDELVFKFASDVNVDQSTEIARMEMMLAALSTTPH